MTCAIVEDEIPAQSILKNFIGKVPDIKLLGAFQTANEANHFFKENRVDFIFLDINLPDIQGIDFIKTLKKPPNIIITTAYPDYALDSYELDTIVDYLVKPFSYDRFLKSTQKLKRINPKMDYDIGDSVFLNIDKELHKIQFDKILYIESDRNYITFFTLQKKFVLIDTLKSWVPKLPEYLLQVHKSYIINLNHIEKISGNTLYIHNIKIPIGRTFKSNVFKNFKT